MTAGSRRKSVSTSTKNSKQPTSRANISANLKGAMRSNVSNTPGKSGQAQPQSKAKAGAPQAQRDIPKVTLKEMKGLHALGVSMTNIHRIVQQKPGLKGVRYYDVWKALRTS